MCWAALVLASFIGKPLVHPAPLVHQARRIVRRALFGFKPWQHNQHGNRVNGGLSG
jgi:hypothetical protein